jgi:hypothetical protein
MEVFFAPYSEFQIALRYIAVASFPRVVGGNPVVRQRTSFISALDARLQHASRGMTSRKSTWICCSTQAILTSNL